MILHAETVEGVAMVIDEKLDVWVVESELWEGGPVMHRIGVCGRYSDGSLKFEAAREMVITFLGRKG